VKLDGFCRGGNSWIDAESGNPSLVEATANVGGFLEPSSDGVPGKPFDASNRRDADTLTLVNDFANPSPDWPAGTCHRPCAS